MKLSVEGTENLNSILEMKLEMKNCTDGDANNLETLCMCENLRERSMCPEC